jgi:hypothetical protein
VQPPAKVLAAAPVKVGDRVQAFANLLKKKQLMPGSIRVIIPESNQVDVDFDGIKTAGARHGWTGRLDGKFVKRQDAMVYLDNQPALSSKNARQRNSVPDSSWQLIGIDSCRWKEDPGVGETERLVFSITSKVSAGGRFVPMEPEEVILVQMFRDSTEHDSAMYAKELCDFMKRLVATPSEGNMHELTGEVRTFMDRQDDQECRAKVYERHANVPVE